MEREQISPIPNVRIEPRRSLIALDIAEVWRYRELLYFLAWRDVKIKYKQTLIGIAWALLQPALTTLIFSLIFSTWVRMDTGTIPYPLFALSGLMVWLFTFSTVTFASNSFVGHANLVTKVYFPRLIVPAAATIAGLFDLVFSLLMLAGMMLFYRTGVGAQLLLAPVFLLLAVIQTAAFGTLLSALNVRFRDVRFALPFLLQIWMIASPVFYPASMVPERFRLLFAVNPMVGILDGFRSALFDLSFDWQLIGVSVTSIIVISVVSLFVFARMEDDFADQI